jgi:hypothetical protein
VLEDRRIRDTFDAAIAAATRRAAELADEFGSNQ